MVASVRFGVEDSDDPGEGEITDLDEKDFEALEDNVDRLAKDAGNEPQSASAAPTSDPAAPIRTEAEFEAAVREAIDGLPDDFQRKLDDVVITVSDDGHTEHAYGMYVPGVGRTDGYRWWFFGIGRRATLSQIVIYRDTLLRDYGRDPALLRAKIKQTVRHEVGHALGFDEDGVRGLGL
jgi:predicted Zn-dependent protease with MMP-like domain